MKIKRSSSEDNVNDLYDQYVKELDGFLNWALSNLNKYRNELLDVGFVVYLELFIRLFKKSTKLGKQFVDQFRDVFTNKFEYYIDKISQYKFVDQLDELMMLNIGYNKKNKLNDGNPSKYVMVLSSNCMRTLKNWLNIYNNSVVNVILLERMEVIDSEMINHSSVNIFKRYFLTKYGIDIEHIYTNYKFGRPYLGLYVKDVELNRVVNTSSLNTNNLLVDNFKDNKILYGLPSEIYSSDYGTDLNIYTLGVGGEYTRLEDCRKLVPLPKPGTLVHDSLRSLYQLQYNNRNLNDKNLYILNYNVCNVNNINCGTISDFDGRYVATGLKDGSILLYDLVKSQCENAYDDISCIIGDDISYKTVNNIYPLYYSNGIGNKNLNVNGVSKNSNKMGSGVNNNLNNNSNMIIDGHDGLVNCLKFGENGQVLLSGGIDSLVKLYVVNSIGYPESGTNSNSNSNTTKCVNYYNSTNDGKLSNSLNKNNGVVNIDYSKYGYYFTTVDLNGYCKLWATDRSYPIRYFKLFATNFIKNRLHPNSSLLSVLCDNNTVKLYDLRSNDNVLDIDPNLDLCSSFGSGNNDRQRTGTSSSSTLLNSSGTPTNGTFDNNNVDRQTRFNKDKTRDLNFSKNGVMLSVYVNNQLLLYDIRINKLFEKVNVHSGNINSVDFSHSTSLLSVTDDSGVLSLWSFNNFNTYIHKTDPNFNLNANSERDVGLSQVSGSHNTKSGGSDGKSGLLAEQRNKDGAKNLVNAYKFNNVSLLGASFTPENVLLTLGLSSL